MKARLTLLLVLSLVLAACASVLGFKRSSQSHLFEHRAHLVKGIDCLTCHAGIPTSGQGDAPHIPSDAACRKCHQKPHDERTCGNCHGEPPIRAGVMLVRSRLRFEHKKHMPAVEGQCVKCHNDITEAAPDNVLPKMATCFGCHNHRDQWTLRDCNGCHVDLQAEEQAPSSHLVHDGDWIREHGTRAASARDLCSSCHTDRSCAACHGVNTVPALPARLAFDDTRMTGLHRAGFKTRHSMEARSDPGLCTTCHSPSSCGSCHAANGVGPGVTSRSPHPAGWITTKAGGGDHGTQARIDPAACAGCHGGAGEMLCVGCHKVGGAGGNPHGRGFSSNKQKTHDMPCRLCHAG